MKNIMKAIILCLGLAALLGSCTNVIDAPAVKALTGETGKITVSIGGTGGRTILPAYPTFSKYEFIFEALDVQEGHDNITVAAGTYSVTAYLSPGNWNVIAKAYVYISGVADIADGDYRAAEGKADILVSAGQIENLFIDVEGGVRPGEKGILTWDISLPDDAENAAVVIRTIEGAEAETINLLDTSQGSLVLDAGYYLVTFILDDQTRSEILHIYGGMTSRVNRSLERPPVFGAISDLANWLNKAGANDYYSPYNIILYGLNLETDFYDDSDPLGKLYEALKGKYVNLDLSSCEGQFIADIPSSLANARSDKDKIVNVLLPEGLSSIGDRAFYYCSRLTHIELPAELSSIGQSAFTGCVMLALTELPGGLTYIGDGAFQMCSGLALTKLPAGITSIKDATFQGCTNLALTELPAGITSIGSYTGWQDNSNFGAFDRCTRLALKELPAGLTKISAGTFNGCTSLALTELPAGLISVGKSAFQGCTNLALTKLPEGLTYIASGTFYNCTKLALTELPEGLTSIYNSESFYGAFYNCSNLALTKLPVNLTYIGSYAFYNCKSLTLTELSAGLISIGSDAFSGCTGLALKELPLGLSTIGSYAFYNCTSLALTELPEGVNSIGSDAFSGCTGLALTKLPEGLTSINGVFEGCTNLALTELPAGLTYLGGGFNGCKNLALTKLPEGLSFIGWQTFAGCTSLALIELPAALSSISASAFQGCTNLALVICNRVTPPSLGADAFANTSDDMVIKVPAQSVTAYKNAPGWSAYADRIEAMHFQVTFTGPTEKQISISTTITNNLSQSAGGSIDLSISETFDRYDWFIGGTKVATGGNVTLYADDPAFSPGLNWITVVVYTGTGPGAIPWSGKFLVQVNE